MEKRWLYQISMVFFTLCFIQITKTVAQEIPEIKLEVIDYFPKENDDNILAGPAFMDMDEQGNFYVSDVTLNTILKFSPEGKYLRNIGEAGQGPGEFTYMYRFCIEKGKIYLDDQANRRIQIISTEGEFIDLFKVFSIPKDLAVWDGQLYTIQFDPAIRVSDPHNGNLIYVLDKSGESIKRFGHYLDLAPNVTITRNSGEIRIYKNLVYLLFAHYPILRVYKLDGHLETTINFTGMKYETRSPINYDWDQYHYKKRVMPWHLLFRAFDVNEFGVFVALYDNTRLIIDQFDHAGKFLQRYTKREPVEKYTLLDMRIRADKNGEPVFYIMDADEDRLPCIEVCRK